MSHEEVPVIDLSLAPGEGETWGRPRLVVYLWAAAEIIFISNPWQVSSRLRVAVLRLFGARIGRGVIFRPRTRVKFPWNLQLGDHTWVGEGVWIHNQDLVTVGSDVVLSQETFVTTGSHALRQDMALITKPVVIEDGAWVTTRCIVLGGTTIGRSAVLTPNTVVGPNTEVIPGAIFGAPAPTVRGDRFVKVDMDARFGQ